MISSLCHFYVLFSINMEKSESTQIAQSVKKRLYRRKTIRAVTGSLLQPRVSILRTILFVDIRGSNCIRRP